MTEEENKAIETLKVLVTTIYYGGMSFKEKDDLKVILRLIEKLQKENEKYKETDQKIKDKINDYKTRTKYIADTYNPIYLEIAKDFEELLEEE